SGAASSPLVGWLCALGAQPAFPPAGWLCILPPDLSNRRVDGAVRGAELGLIRDRRWSGAAVPVGPLGRGCSLTPACRDVSPSGRLVRCGQAQRARGAVVFGAPALFFPPGRTAVEIGSRQLPPGGPSGLRGCR